MEPLVESLRQATRTVTKLLSELKIRCQFFDRGCGQFIELGDVERHVTDCGFAPAVCSNAGCQLEVNKQDLLHHETAVCELRRVKCHSCNEIRQEMDTVKVNLATMNEKLKGVGEQLAGNEKQMDRNQENVKTQFRNVVAKVELVQEQLRGQLNKQEESNRRLEADNVEIKRSLNEITKQLKRMTQQTSHEVQAEEMKKDIVEGGMDRKPKVLVAGGWDGTRHLNSVEMFSHSNATWTPLKPMKESRTRAYSVVHNNQVFVIGGHDKNAAMKSIEKLSLNAVHAVDQSITWENVLVKLPAPLKGHCSVVYNGRLTVIGGYDGGIYSDSIIEISLLPPYTNKLLTAMPQSRCHHGIAMFGDKILILAGTVLILAYSTKFASVLLYDIIKNECKELAALPYPVSAMATVKWGDGNVIIVGGADSNAQPLNKVLLYNIKTQKSRMLPDMKYKRKGCVAAVVRDTVIVMGGRDERGKYLKSVECFQFDRYSWQELPEMREVRYCATAVVC
ncbi:kelch repeat and K+ channel tetramerization domain containing [Paramuricea clavata]|uniref:Kelch repeat and K+ channel tetramerization domain containing n=1 Tax=Paramuricea clavata TaxID=317549 RepID=A0A6S7L9X9_PARCT|nr:kelch repeat and K+ channel tetramerization domain containing [Paramuricea clavata]